ncbi:MAG: acetyl-CoA hydrolase/transferase family protein [Candidatus Eremiobacteraeota bacterium]|nr:acetyl-CoA hydrolase/transferase family protein [Candidatus Eremiobacteraeota bacterium]MCW5872264.1 acetyl-CoA hydrolase/transferase family protein [Candidatus Eremiobacteraeota bacterium]
MLNWESQAVSATQVVQMVQSGQRLFVHGAAATPAELLEALCRRTDLRSLQLYHLHLDGPCPFEGEEFAGRIFSNSLFVGAGLRAAVAAGRADYIPTFLSDIPALFSGGALPLDVALLHLSPPDAHGNCSLGTSVDAALAAAQNARLVVAQINRQMPRTHGNGVIPLASLKAYTIIDRPLPQTRPAPIGAVEESIGQLVAELIPDGATLQMGIGAIPDAVLQRLGNKLDLGVHTEMFSDGLLPLLCGGVITNRYKSVHPNRTVTSFVNGTRALYDFVNDNPLVEFHPCDRTNDVSLIRKNPRVCAINSALEVDLSGQVCADSMGFNIFSGIGGQMDFMRGAVLSPGGRAVIALPSTAASGRVSRIVSSLKPGAGVVTTRGHVQWLVTEYGALNLHGLNLRQRAEGLIGLAHPDFRAQLRREICQARHFDFGKAESFE